MSGADPMRRLLGLGPDTPLVIEPLPVPVTVLRASTDRVVVRVGRAIEDRRRRNAGVAVIDVLATSTDASTFDSASAERQSAAELVGTVARSGVTLDDVVVRVSGVEIDLPRGDSSNDLAIALWRWLSGGATVRCHGIDGSLRRRRTEPIRRSLFPRNDRHASHRDPDLVDHVPPLRAHGQRPGQHGTPRYLIELRSSADRDTRQRQIERLLADDLDCHLLVVDPSGSIVPVPDVDDRRITTVHHVAAAWTVSIEGELLVEAGTVERLAELAAEHESGVVRVALPEPIAQEASLTLARRGAVGGIVPVVEALDAVLLRRAGVWWVPAASVGLGGPPSSRPDLIGVSKAIDNRSLESIYRSQRGRSTRGLRERAVQRLRRLIHPVWVRLPASLTGRLKRLVGRPTDA